MGLVIIASVVIGVLSGMAFWRAGRTSGLIPTSNRLATGAAATALLTGCGALILISRLIEITGSSGPYQYWHNSPATFLIFHLRSVVTFILIVPGPLVAITCAGLSNRLFYSNNLKAGWLMIIPSVLLVIDWLLLLFFLEFAPTI